MLAHLKKTADQMGLPFGERHMTFNSRKAQELSKWAEQRGLGDAFHRAVFEAYFAEGRNIGRLPVLLEIVQVIGGDPEKARIALNDSHFKAAVDQDWQRSRSMGSPPCRPSSPTAAAWWVPIVTRIWRVL